MATPADLADLAIGFSPTEGIAQVEAALRQAAKNYDEFARYATNISAP